MDHDGLFIAHWRGRRREGGGEGGGEAEGSETEGGSRRCRTSPPEAVNLVNLWEGG